MEMGVSLSRRRQSPGRGFWEGGRAKRANERQVTWGRTPVLRKRRNRRRLPCQPAPPPRPNRHPPPCRPGQSAVSNASPACFITHETDPNHPEHTTHPKPKDARPAANAPSPSNAHAQLPTPAPAPPPRARLPRTATPMPANKRDGHTPQRPSPATSAESRHSRQPQTRERRVGEKKKNERLEQNEVA